MKVDLNDRHFNCGIVPTEITRAQWVLLKLSGKVFVDYLKKPRWTGTLPFFIVKCKICGCYFFDYPHGHSGRFDCPVCDVKPEIMVDVREVEAVAVAV